MNISVRLMACIEEVGEISTDTQNERMLLTRFITRNNTLRFPRPLLLDYYEGQGARAA